MEELRATASYQAVNEALAEALRAQAVPAIAKTAATSRSGPAVGAAETRSDPAAAGAVPGAADPAGVCFERAEVHDVVHEHSGAKIAGAAQKRNKHGLLFQGSIWRPACAVTVDWDVFEEDFVARLTHALGAVEQRIGWPDFDESEVAGLTEQYSSEDWLALR